MVQVQYFGNRYELENLYQCGKWVKTKSQKVFGANSYVCRNCRGKTGSEGLFVCPPSWIGLTFRLQAKILNQISFMKPRFVFFFAEATGAVYGLPFSYFPFEYV